MKKLITLFLAMLMFTACAAPATQTSPATQATEPAPTQPAEEAKVLKVLTLGHSLAVDAGHMLALVASAEGYGQMKIGTLFYSGCPLSSHVKFMTQNLPEYKLYVSSTADPYTPPTVMAEVTMKDALRFDYWDIVIMQGGVFEIGRNSAYTDGNIQKIQQFAKENALNPTLYFGWNMAWAPPLDNTLRDMYPYEENPYYTTYPEFNNDRTTLYNAITKCVETNILTEDSFQFVIPSGTAIENALSSYMEEKDIHRDYVHASDFSRVMVSYVWFCRLTGVEHLEQIKLDTVPQALFLSREKGEDWVLTEAEKALMLEAVNNALSNPLEMTQSVYTERP